MENDLQQFRDRKKQYGLPIVLRPFRLTPNFEAKRRLIAEPTDGRRSDGTDGVFFPRLVLTGFIREILLTASFLGLISPGPSGTKHCTSEGRTCLGPLNQKKEVDAMKSKNGSFGRRPRAMMSSFLRRLPVFLVPVVALILASAAPELRAKELQFDRAKIIIEFNSTANEGVGDVGVQVLLDGEPWQLLKIKDPHSRTILNVTASSSLRRQGLTEFFFESSEPSLDEVPLAEFLARFPEGEYEFEGRTIEGRKIEGEATFTHVIPKGPVIVAPENDAVVDPSSLVIEWEPVTEKIAGSGPLVVVAYQVVVDGGDPARRFDVTVAAKNTNMSVTVPPEFLEPGTEYTFEVLAIEAGGNQTITEGFFATQ
jgi:hypothetical protein